MFDQPFVRDSFIQQIDPRMRVLLAVLLAVALALLRQMTACCLGLGLGCVLLGLAQAPLGPLWRRLVAINMFILFLWLVTPWTTPGAVVWQWHFIQVSREGVYLFIGWGMAGFDDGGPSARVPAAYESAYVQNSLLLVGAAAGAQP